MPHLVGMIENLWLQTASYLTFLYQPPFPHLDGEHPHDCILRALMAGDPEEVVRQVRRDIDGHGRLLMSTLREQRIID